MDGWNEMEGMGGKWPLCRVVSCRVAGCAGWMDGLCVLCVVLCALQWNTCRYEEERIKDKLTDYFKMDQPLPHDW